MGFALITLSFNKLKEVIYMKYKVIDLSMEMYPGIQTMPMDPKFDITQHCTLDTLGYNLSRITMSTHQSTHLDAPRHFFYEGQTVDKIPAERFVGKAIKIDLRHKRAKEVITPQDLKAYDDRIVKGANILLDTGWDETLPDAKYFSDFPYVTTELADYLASRQINLVGMDMPTPNPTDWQYVHKRLLDAGVIIVEGLVNMKEISGDECTLVALPLKLKDADGSPIRAVAIEGDFN